MCSTGQEIEKSAWQKVHSIRLRINENKLQVIGISLAGSEIARQDFLPHEHRIVRNLIIFLLKRRTQWKERKYHFCG